MPPLLTDLAGWGWRVLLLFGVGWVVLLALRQFGLVVVPLAVALLANALLAPATRALRARGLSRMAVTIVVVLPCLAVVGNLLGWIVDQAVRQSPALVDQLGETVRRLPIPSDTFTHWRDQLVSYVAAHRDVVAQNVLNGLLTGAELVTGAALTLLFSLILMTDGPDVDVGGRPVPRRRASQHPERRQGCVSGACPAGSGAPCSSPCSTASSWP